MSNKPSFEYKVVKITDYHWELQKYEVWGNPSPEQYDVTFTKSDRPWCNCMGMRYFAGKEEEHKHIKIVRAYRELSEDEQKDAVFLIHESKVKGKTVNIIETIIRPS